MHRTRSYHLHLPFYHIDDSRNLRLLYITRILKDLVNKISIFFLPIFLFELGKSSSLLSFLPVTEFQKGMILLSGFIFFAKIISLLLAIPLAQMIRKYGFQRAFTYSYFFRLICFCALFFSPQMPLLLPIAIITDAIQSNLFWNTYHTILSKHTLRMNMGKDLSIIQFFLQTVAVAAPALAGILAQTFGLEVLFLFGIVGTLVAFVCTLEMTFEHDSSTVSFAELRRWLSERTYEKFALGQAGKYIHDSILFLWPLYLYLFLGSVEKVGFLYTISLFLVLIVTIFFGIFIDLSKSKKPYYLSGGILSALWILRAQTFHVFGFMLIDAVDKLVSNFHWLYFDVLYLKRGKGRKALAYFVYGEMIHNFVTAIFWLLFCIFFLFSTDWKGFLIFGAVGVLMSTFISDKDREQ